jgi:DNA-binding winged helix-turn-helix (wHTH) protein
MEFRVLGPLEVVEHGSPLKLGPGKQRALLAVLLLARGAPVPSEHLVDALWGEAPPASAAKSVQIYVSHLRKVLGDRLETRGKGYALRVDPDELDAARFEAAFEEGRDRRAAGDAEGAAAVLREALGLWRELGRPAHQYAVYAAQAAELLLDAIARSDGTRASVASELLGTDVDDGILGDFAVTDSGDTTATQVTMYDVADGRLRFREVLRPPVNLLAGG